MAALTGRLGDPYNSAFLNSGGFMYAVIRSGGKQYRVSPGETIRVDKLAGKAGSKVEFDEVLSVHTDEKKFLSGKNAGKATVTGKILSHDRYPKIKVIKFKTGGQYKITRGHRQDFTSVQVSGIEIG
jgi:large subunit ribosomal protein L21